MQAGTDFLTPLKQSGTYHDENPLAPEPSPFVGEAACVSCHATIARSQQKSLHAQTFRRNPGCTDLALPARPLVDPADPSVTHRLECAGGKVRFETTEAQKTSSGLVEFLFGSGKHGKTLVGRDDSGRDREFRLSEYSDSPGWDLTTGHPAHPSAGEGFLGRLLTPDDVRSCFVCHTTVARSAQEQRGPESNDRAIGCERCHGPGGNHLKAVAGKYSDLAIAQPRLARAPQVVALCAQCHSPMGREVARDDPLAVRFPSSSLTWSRCYTESGGKLDCRTCHDPHSSVAQTTAVHESKCLQCHTRSAPDAPPHPGETTRKTACPINPKRDCLSCHMPTVKVAIPHATFTDHNIRIRPAGSR